MLLLLLGLTGIKTNRFANDDTSSKLTTPRPRKGREFIRSTSGPAAKINFRLIRRNMSHARSFSANRNLPLKELLLRDPTMSPGMRSPEARSDSSQGNHRIVPTPAREILKDAPNW